jgi:1-acyl-sn-glycerol-3-phosphate acyltransferase
MDTQVRSVKSPTFPGWVLIVPQTLIYLVSAIPLRLWYRARKQLPGNIEKLREGSLLVANHQSLVDPFFIVMSLPIHVYMRLLPIRFPTADWAYTSWHFNPPFFPFLKLLGCFTIGTTSTDKMRAMFYIRELLKQRKTVMLFPEGEITDKESEGCTQRTLCATQGFQQCERG